MKLPPAKNKPTVVIHKERDYTKELAELDSTLARIQGEIAETELRSRNLVSMTDEAIRKKAQTFIEMLDRHMADVEQRVLYSILDFLGNCPFWELLKIDEREHNRSDAARTFSDALRKGWRYLGSYMNPASSIPKERYTLMIRPKGGPIADGQYLKFYEEFQARRDAEAKAAKTLLSKPKAKPVTTTKVTPAAPKVQLKVKAKTAKN